MNHLPLPPYFFLLQKGYECTLFDKNELAGGALRYLVPEDRFPKQVLDKEVESVEKLGAIFKMNHEIFKDSLPKLQKEFDAVIIASGEDNADFEGPEKKNKSFIINRNTFLTSMEGVFAIGSAIKPGRVARHQANQSPSTANAAPETRCPHQ